MRSCFLLYYHYPDLTKETGAADETLFKAAEVKCNRDIFHHEGDNKDLHGVDNPPLTKQGRTSEGIGGTMNWRTQALTADRGQRG